MSLIFNNLVTSKFMFRVRFEEMCGYTTKILFQTDGMLLREAMLDPLLKK